MPYGLPPLERWQSLSEQKVLRQKKIPLVLFEDWKVWRQLKSESVEVIKYCQRIDLWRNFYTKRSFQWNCKINRKLCSQRFASMSFFKLKRESHIIFYRKNVNHIFLLNQTEKLTAKWTLQWCVCIDLTRTKFVMWNREPQHSVDFTVWGI